MASVEQGDIPWLKVRPIRTKITIEHITPYERRFTEEITFLNTGDSDVVDLPLPLNDFRHGIQVLDENNSVLPYYSREELDAIVLTLERQLQENIDRQLQEGYLLWIRLPKDKSISPNQLRTIRLIFVGPENATIPKLAFFDIAQYAETIGKGINPLETFYFIQSPKNFIVEVMQKKTYAEDEVNKESIGIQYLDKTASPEDFKDDCIDIKNRKHYISARFPVRKVPYKVALYYQIKLPKVERWIWRIALPLAAVLLAALIAMDLSAGNSKIFSDTSLLVIGASVITLAAALIALENNPLIRRTRAFLFIHIGEAIILVVKTGLIKP